MLQARVPWVRRVPSSREFCCRQRTSWGRSGLWNFFGGLRPGKSRDLSLEYHFQKYHSQLAALASARGKSLKTERIEISLASGEPGAEALSALRFSWVGRVSGAFVAYREVPVCVAFPTPRLASAVAGKFTGQGTGRIRT